MTQKPEGHDEVSFNGVAFEHQLINKVVDQFYTKISQDDLLSQPFSSVGDWPYHIERMTQFWWIKFSGKPYMFSQYSPIPKHFYSGFNETLLTRWLDIFKETLHEAQVNQAQYKEWSEMAMRIGDFLTIKNGQFSDYLNKQENTNK